MDRQRSSNQVLSQPISIRLLAKVTPLVMSCAIADPIIKHCVVLLVHYQFQVIIIKC